MVDSPVSRVTRRGYPGGINEEFLYAHPDVRAKVLDGKLLAKRIHLEIKDSVKEMVGVGKRCVTWTECTCTHAHTHQIIVVYPSTFITFTISVSDIVCVCQCLVNSILLGFKPGNHKRVFL